MKKIVRENLNENHENQTYQSSGYAVTFNFEDMKGALQQLADICNVKIMMDVTPGLLFRNKILWKVHGTKENVTKFITKYKKLTTD